MPNGRCVTVFLLKALRRAMIGALLCLVLPSATAQSAIVVDYRVALVIGNAKYVGWPSLDNPVNDARSMAAALKKLKFDVILVTDADLGTMQKAIRRFRAKLRKGGTGLFYYSGHGVQVDLANYLIPTRGTVEYAEDIPNSSIDANVILKTMGEARSRVNFVILDACRNNVLKRRDNSKVGGLARMDAPKGTLIAYATGPNQIANDGVGKNSLYTAELLKVISEPGLQVEAMFKRVRRRVDHVSDGSQIPVEFTSLTGDFYFRAAKRRTSRPSQAASKSFEVAPYNKRFEALRRIGVREKPLNSAPIVARLSAQEGVTATGRVRDRDWLQVSTRGGIKGYVPDYLLRLPFTWKVKPHKGVYEVIEKTGLHTQPRSASRRLASLPSGRSINASGRVEGLNWLRVKTRDGMKGFIHRSALDKPFSYSVIPFNGTFEAVTEVKLLKQPRISSKQLASLATGERVTAIGRIRGRDWLEVKRRSGLTGFVREALLAIPFEWREKKFAGKDNTFKTVAAANLRAEPRASSKLLASLTPNQQVVAVAKVVERDWLKVMIGKQKTRGYVLENLLQLVVARPDAASFKDGAEFRDCPACPLMVVVPAGGFVMGSSGGNRSERPPHTVTLRRKFALGKYEVTFKEWDACIADGGCRSKPFDEGWGRGNRPVINVTWDDAKEYVRWLSGKTGERYHLPSEAQWEYAARAKSTSKYAWGNSIGRNRANCSSCGSQFAGKQTAPAGSFKPNRFGLHDMHGNVWEWVEDCWHRTYKRAPTDGSAWTTGACGQSVLRGGSWREGSSALRASQRTKYHSAPHNTFGFRVARIVGG